MAKAKKKTLMQQLEEGTLSLKPTQRLVTGPAGERIVEKSLREQVVEGLVSVGPGQKVVGTGEAARVVDKTAQELLSEGLVPLRDLVGEGRVTPEQARDAVLSRLRRETAARFDAHRTAGGHRLDDLARQKAAASLPFRHLPAGEEPKKGLLAAGMIYPDAVLDEILAAVGEVQAAYRAAKAAVTTAAGKGQAVAKWEGIALADFLPGAKKPPAAPAKPGKGAKGAAARGAKKAPKAAPKNAAPKRAAPKQAGSKKGAPKKPAGRKKGSPS